MARLCEYSGYRGKKRWWPVGRLSSRHRRLEMVRNCSHRSMTTHARLSWFSRSFLVQCPLSLAAIILVGWKLKGPDPSLSFLETEGKPRNFRRIDIWGSAALALTISTFILALDIGGQQLPWTHPAVLILFASSILLGLLFLLVEAFVADEPLLPLGLLVQRDIMTSNVLATLQTAAQFGVYSPADWFRLVRRSA